MWTFFIISTLCILCSIVLLCVRAWCWAQAQLANGCLRMPPTCLHGTAIARRIRRYAGQGVELVVKGATAYAWLTSMCIVALVPLDVWTTLAQITAGRAFVGVLWSISYWCVVVHVVVHSCQQERPAGQQQLCFCVRVQLQPMPA
jgi:hypothetical protein